MNFFEILIFTQSDISQLQARSLRQVTGGGADFGMGVGWERPVIKFTNICHGPVDETMDSQSEFPGSNLLVAAFLPLGKALHPHCIVLQRDLKAIGPLVAYLQASFFLYSGHV